MDFGGSFRGLDRYPEFFYHYEIAVVFRICQTAILMSADVLRSLIASVAQLNKRNEMISRGVQPDLPVDYLRG